MHVRMGVDLRKPASAATAHATDARLQHAIEQDVRLGHPRAALALHMSRLQPPAPRPYHRRIAKALVDRAAQEFGGQVFVRNNADIVLIGTPAAVTRLRGTLSRLFRVDAPPDDKLLSLWTLPQDQVALETYCSRNVAASPAAQEPSGAPAAIGALETMIGLVRLTDLIRRQMAVRAVPGGLAPLHRELTFSMDALDARIHAAGSAQADAYLFRHLAGHLDIRMMDLLAHELLRPGALAPNPALHVNLTVRAILSPAFLRLADAAQSAGAGLGVEIALMEACADPLAYGAARMVLRAHNVTVVLDNVSHQALLLSRPESLEPDLVKLDWTPRMASLAASERRLLDEGMARIGTKRLLLHRVETAAAFDWAVERGLSLFQGRHIDSLLGAGRLAECPQASACTVPQCVERAGATGAAGRAGCRNTALLDSPETLSTARA